MMMVEFMEKEYCLIYLEQYAPEDALCDHCGLDESGFCMFSRWAEPYDVERIFSDPCY